MADAHRRAAIAERAARAGGAVARQSFRGALTVDTKADKTDLVTDADRDAQRQIIATIRDEFPGDAIVAEEDAVPVGGVTDDVRPNGGSATDSPGLAETVPEQGDAWVVDPIDGTSNYARGLGLWTTSVAAVVNREPVGSVTYLPAQGDVYAVGPDSATRDGSSLAVSEAADPETFAVGIAGHWTADQADAFGDLCAGLTRHLGDVRRFGSMQATLAFVSDGGLEAAVATTAHDPWDTVAGVHLIRSAGGVVTDLQGEPWHIDSVGLVASNGEAHDAVVDAVRARANR